MQMLTKPYSPVSVSQLLSGAMVVQIGTNPGPPLDIAKVMGGLIMELSMGLMYALPFPS